MRGRKGIPQTASAGAGRPHLFSSQHEPAAYKVLMFLKESGAALSATEIFSLIEAEDPDYKHVLRVLTRTGMVFEDRTHWPPRFTFNKERFEVLEEKLSKQPNMGWLDTETVEGMGEEHPLKNRVFPCPGNLLHAPALTDHWHVLPAGVRRPE